MPTETNNINPNTGLAYSKQDLEAIQIANRVNNANSKISPLDTRFSSIGANLNLESPEELASYTDRGVTLQVGGANEEIRAENQSAGEQMAYGLAKMTTTAGTTFLDGTVGSIVGLGSLLTGGSFIDNPFSNAMLDFNEKMEEKFTNYYTNEGQEAFAGIIPFTEGSANFWGDKILKNFGFALGAFGAGLATSAVGGLAAEKIMAGRAGKAIVATLQSEGKSAVEIDKMLKAVQAGDKAAIDLLKPSKQVLEAIKADAKIAQSLDIANQWTASIGGAVGESRIEALGNAREFKERGLVELEDKYGNNIPKEELDALEQRTNSYMNTTFGINMAILTLSDYTQFSDAFKTKYAKQKALLNNVSGGIEKGFKNEGIGTLEKVGRLLKNPVAEGTQEQLQYATQKGSDNYYSQRFDENGKEVVNGFVESYMKGLSEAYGTAEGWEMFATGAIIGSLGMPNIKKLTGKDGLVQGGIYGEYQEMKQQEANTNKAVQDINKISESLMSQKDSYEHLVRSNKLSEKQRQAAEKDDKFEYINAGEDKFLSEVLAFQEAGKVEDLEDFYKGLANKKGADVRTTQQTKDDKGNVIDPFKNLTDAEIEVYFKNKSKDALEKIKTIRDLKEDIDGRFANMPDSYKEELLHYGYTIKDVDKRFSELSQEIAAKTVNSYIIAKDEKGNLLDSFISVFEDPIKFAEYVNKEEGQKEYKKLINDYVKRHPEDNQLKQKADDLIKLADRKKEFVNKYIDGLTVKGRNALIDSMKAMVDAATNKSISRKEARDKFNEQLLAKGYTLERIKNTDGIHIKYGDALLTLKTINGERVVVDAITGKPITKFKNSEQFDDFLLTKEFTVFSIDEAREFRNNIKNQNIRRAELQALRQLLNQTKQDGLALNQKIEAKDKELKEKVKELNSLLNDYKNSTVSDPIFISQVEDLIIDLEIAIDELQKEISSLTKQRDNLRELYTFYQNEFNILEKTDGPINYKQQAKDQAITANIIREDLDPSLTLEEVDNAINDLEVVIEAYQRQLDTYIKQLELLSSVIEEDQAIRNFLENINFQKTFEAKYKDKVNTKLTTNFIKRYLYEQSNLNNLNNEELDNINQILEALERNPNFINDLNSLLEHKIELEKINRRLKFNTAEVEMVGFQINKVKSSLNEFNKELEKLKDNKAKIEYLQKGTSNAYNMLRNKIASIFKRNETVHYTEESPLNERGDPAVYTDTDKSYNEAENAKKGTPYSTTGVVIMYKYNSKIGKNEDVIDGDGNPVYTTSESQLRWGKFLDDNSNELRKADGDYMIEFHLHDPNSTNELDKEINSNISSEYRESGNDIYAVIVKKDGSPVLVNGKHLFTGIHKTNTLFPGNGEVRLLVKEALIRNVNEKLADLIYLPQSSPDMKVSMNGQTKTKKEWEETANFDTIVEDEVNKIIEETKEKFDNVRETIKKTIKEKGKAYSSIKDVSNGIPVIGKTTREANKLLGPTFKLQLNEFNKKSGLWYAISNDGKRIPVETNMLGDISSTNNNTMVDVLIKVLQYAMPDNSTEVVEYFNLPKGQTIGTETKIPIFPTAKGQVSLLGSIIYYGRNKRNEAPAPYMIWGKEYIQYIDANGKKVNVSRNALHNPKSEEHQKLRDFLATKKLNISKKASESSLYFYEPVLDSKGELTTKQYASDKKGSTNYESGYKKFIRKHLRTRLVNVSEDKPLFTNRYIVYNPVKSELPVKKVPVKETSNDEFEGYSIGGIDFDLSGYDIDDAITMTGDTANALKSGNSPITSVKSKEANNAFEIFTPTAGEVDTKQPSLDANSFGFEEPSNTNNSQNIFDEFNIAPPSNTGKQRVISITKEDAISRLKSLLQEGKVDKNCS